MDLKIELLKRPQLDFPGTNELTKQLACDQIWAKRTHKIQAFSLFYNTSQFTNKHYNLMFINPLYMYYMLNIFTGVNEYFISFLGKQTDTDCWNSNSREEQDLLFF